MMKTRVYISILCVIMFYNLSIFARPSDKVFPVSLKVQIENIDLMDYLVTEVSNSEHGYVVQLQTDVTGYVLYNGNEVAIVDGKAILTHIKHQDKPISQLRILSFKTKPKYFSVSIATE